MSCTYPHHPHLVSGTSGQTGSDFCAWTDDFFVIPAAPQEASYLSGEATSGLQPPIPPVFSTSE